MSRIDDARGRIEEIRARRAEILTTIQALADVEAPDDTQRSDENSLYEEDATLEAELAPLNEVLARHDRLEAAVAAQQTATGDGAAGFAAARAGLNVIRDAGDIYDRSALNLANPADGPVYRDRAMRSIDSWRGASADQKESAARHVEWADEESDDPRIKNTAREVADHILRFSAPVYVRAFKHFLRYGAPGLPLLPADQARAFQDGMAQSRALNEGSVAAGQAIVPPFLDPTIILTNAGVSNPFRNLATVKTITTQTWKGVTSAGVTAEWTAEASEFTDASPTFTQPSITPIRADAYVQVSFEMVEDTSIASDVAMLFGEARDRLEGAAFAVGTGSTQPTGVVTALGLTTTSRQASLSNGGPIQLADIYALDNNLPQRFRAGASFAMAKGIANLVRQATTPSLVNFSPWVDFGGGLPPTAIGYPVYQASGMLNSLSAATASNDDCIVLGDFRQGYYIVDRVGLSIANVPIVFGSNRRPTGEMGWACWWRVGGNVVIPGAFQMLRV